MWQLVCPKLKKNQSNQWSSSNSQVKANKLEQKTKNNLSNWKHIQKSHTSQPQPRDLRWWFSKSKESHELLAHEPSPCLIETCSDTVRLRHLLLRDVGFRLIEFWYTSSIQSWETMISRSKQLTNYADRQGNCLLSRRWSSISLESSIHVLIFPQDCIIRMYGVEIFT